MRESSADASIVRDYALKKKITIRAAQIHRKDGHPDWVAFRAGIKAREVEVAVTPDGDREEIQALTRYEQISQILEGAIARRDSTRMTTIIKAAQEAHKLLTSVRQNNLETRRASGRLVDLPSVSELIQGNLTILRGRLDDLPEVISTRITDSNLDVSGIVRSEVDSILKELESAASGIPQTDAK
jgi:hypothetical protein